MNPFVWYITAVRGSKCSPLSFARRMRGHSPLMLIEGVRVGGRTCAVVAAGATHSFRAVGHLAYLTNHDDAPLALPDGPDPLAQLYRLVEQSSWVPEGGPLQLLPDPRILGSWVGFMSYDAVRCFERLPDPPEPPPSARTIPDYAFFRPTRLIVFDPEDDRVILAGYNPDGRVRGQLNELAEWLRAPDTASERASIPPAQSVLDPKVLRMRLSAEEYVDRVRRAKEYILDGEIFQVVLSLPCEVPCREDPFTIYDRLRKLNPSPLQYCYIDEELAVVGASPEPLVTYEDGTAATRPLAGTRRRSGDAETDGMLEAELRSSIKELAEHRMLVDLARNDLGRVCSAGSVTVSELLTVERYSHVMHLVSEAVGELPKGIGLDALIRSCFPAGTMTGTPKVRAMEIIEELEPIRRGIYAGGVGLIAPSWLRLYLCIRSLVLTDGVAYARAGAGIVYDSDPAAEHAECLAKLRAPLAALGLSLEAP